MKKRSFYLSIIAMIFVAGLMFSACNKSGSSNKTKDNRIEKAVDKTGKEYTSAYVCPMRCKGSGSDKPGNCPKCKMEYVENESLKKDKEDTQ